MPQSIQIRSDGAANSQVVDEVKAALAKELRSRGVSGAHRDITDSNVLFTHFCDGEYVAISNAGVSDDELEAFNTAIWDIGTDAYRNQVVKDEDGSADCVWVHRAWIADLMDTEAVEDSRTTAEG